MQIHYITIIIAALVQFILGALWYSPLVFGKWWMQIMEADHIPKEELKKMQRSMGPFLFLQFVLTLVQTFVLAMALFYMKMPATGFASYAVAFWIWLGFMVPVQVSAVIFANTKKKFWAKQIFVMVTYQLIGILIASAILG